MINEISTVAIVPCDSYDFEKVYKAVLNGINALGGIGGFVDTSERILLKPNFLYPADSDKAITTHPAVISAVCRVLSESGYHSVMIGDSPANGSNSAAMKKTQLDEQQLFGVSIADMTKESDDKLHLCREAHEVDAIIGICKMKTHALERITGAVKNMYGLMCGYRKAAGHVSHTTAVSFAKMLCEIHKATPQRLHIMDGIVAMEGNGPSSGDPVSMNVILISSDPVALDTVFCELIDLHPELVPTNTQGSLNGLGNYQADKIRRVLVSDASDTAVTEISKAELFEKFGKSDFKVQREKDKFSVLSLWDRLTGGKRKPVIDASKCIKCGVCVEHCPVEGKAVDFKNGKDNVPQYDYKKCIRCYCCQELCPRHAISVK